MGCTSILGASTLLHPSNLKLLLPSSSSSSSHTQTQEINSFLLHTTITRRSSRRTNNKNQYYSKVPVSRLFGPSTFEASKLKVVFVDENKQKHNNNNNNKHCTADGDYGLTLPRTYTLTHCDITSKLTLAISQTINTSQLEGWYQRLQRDAVVAEWKKIQGKMSLHVHCHISGAHFLLDFFAHLRYCIFSKELPVVLKAFVHGDGKLFNNYPELQEALAWVYFHSNNPRFNRVECWGPLSVASSSDGHKLDKDFLTFEHRTSTSTGPIHIQPMQWANQFLESKYKGLN